MLSEKHKLRMFDSRVLRMLFCPEREKVAEDWRSLQKES
jgi:hypothetical protein